VDVKLIFVEARTTIHFFVRYLPIAVAFNTLEQVSDDVHQHITASYNDQGRKLGRNIDILMGTIFEKSL
jgi:hypothetical protein